MAETNFKIFNEANTADKTFNDSEYTNATQRQNGVTPGMAISRLHNKLYLQVSAMAKAVADFIVSQGHDCYDNNVSEITTNLQAAITNVAGNDISEHNTDNAAHENRFSLFQKISTLGDDIIKKLALTTTITVITALQTNSWFGQLLKMVLNASGVKYSMAQNGYICLGSFFGGLIIQWINYIDWGPGDGTNLTINFPVSCPNNTLLAILSDTAGRIDASSMEGAYVVGYTNTSVEIRSAWGHDYANDITALLIIGY